MGGKRRARRDEVYLKALEYFALNEKGHVYGLMKQEGIRYYSAAFEAVQRLKQEGSIYLIDEERVGPGKPPRKLYRLSIFGFLKIIARFHQQFIEVIKKGGCDEELAELLLKLKKVFEIVPFAFYARGGGEINLRYIGWGFKKGLFGFIGRIVVTIDNDGGFITEIFD